MTITNDAKCKECGFHAVDALHFCSQCRRFLSRNLDVTNEIWRDLMAPEPKPAPDVPLCGRCPRPRERDSVFCKAHRKVVAAPGVIGADRCKQCSMTAMCGGYCTYHWGVYGRRGPNGE